MPELNGLEATRQILKARPDTQILIFTVQDSDHLVLEVLNAGARGFLLKSDAGGELLSALEAFQQGRTYFTPTVAAMLLDSYLGNTPGIAEPDTSGRLNSLEREIVQLIVKGKTSKDIASVLNLSAKTVEAQRANVMRKLAVDSISDLVLYAVRNGIVHVEHPTSDASCAREPSS